MLDISIKNKLRMAKALGETMRTIKRISDTINIGKSKELDAVIKAFNQEKQYWLSKLQCPNNILYTNEFRAFRDRQFANKYKSQYGLQARQWKMALTEASDTMHKYWLSTLDKVRQSIIAHTGLTTIQKHYANYLIHNNGGLYQRLSQILSQQIIAVTSPTFKDMPIKDQLTVTKYLLRIIKKTRRNYPRTKLKRSMSLDANMYDVLEKNGKQYLSIMSLNCGKRIKVPLLGNTQGTKDIKSGKMYFGNIRIVKYKNTLEMHYGHETTPQYVAKVDHPAINDIIGIDLGYSEVFVDSNGVHYGTKFGEHLKDKSDQLKEKNQKRNKLFQLTEKYTRQNKPDKANNINKFNLGKIKYNKLIDKQNATSERIINQAINELTKQNPHKIIISEKLDKSISKNLGKNWNRRLSSWLKGSIRERIEFKALAKGFSHKQVNASYTSQTCPTCGYVDRRNRKQDKFECLNCKHEGA
jgi:IS605 OrfB family transposase